MRLDEKGNECPETLGEYYKICLALFGEESQATIFIKNKIKEEGEDMKVVVSDASMRQLLFGMAIGITQ